MKEGYKKTELGVIPLDWEVKKLRDLGNGIIGLTYSPDDLVEDTQQGTLVLRSSNIKNNRLSFVDNKYVSKDIPDKLIVKENDILICSRNGSRELIGKCAIIDKQNEGSSFGAFMTIYRSDYNKFLFHVFDSYIFKRQIYNNLGATINQITTDNLNNFKVPFPSLEEQEKIADVLSNVDSQIDDTDKLIEKTKELKKGLMQRLLTKGISNKEFKKSELGEIPVKWKVKNIDEVAKRYSGHTPDKKVKNYWNGDIPWISLKDTKKLDDRYINETEDYTTEDGINNSSAVILPKNTVVLSRDATIGKVGITSKEMATSQHFINYVCGSSLDSLYLYYDFLNKKSLFERMGIGSTIKTIGLSFFKELKIVIPPIEEQKQIANILSSVDNQIEEYENKKIKLEELKKGLLQQLLTGNIRIK